MKSIDAYVAANPNAATGAASVAKSVERGKERKVREADGFYKCNHSGCNKYYDPQSNTDNTACTYHPGKAVFHDTIKYYDCCPKNQAYDWDQFMALPGCQTGPHD